MKNYFDLTGKVALVTGASSGLGVQFAKALGGQGAKLALVARRLERLEIVKAELEGLGYEVFITKCDVTDIKDVELAVRTIVNHYGTIDILVNNAGVATSGPSESLDVDEWDRVVDTNLNSVYYVSREVGKIMKQNGYGKIINLGSIHSIVAMAQFPIASYAATKGGVLMLTKALAVEWAKFGITVNAIGPAYFKSEMTEAALDTDGFKQVVEAYCPMGRVGNPGELDGAILYFASDASSYTTGQLLQIDGGWTAI